MPHSSVRYRAAQLASLPKEAQTFHLYPGTVSMTIEKVITLFDFSRR
jgi:hypothetical protein